MASKVDVMNLALEKLGQSIAIQSPDENTKHGKLLNRAWSRVLDFVLADGSWPFAVRAVALAQPAEAAFPGWAYRYTYPTDCLRLLAVTSSAGVRAVLSAAADTQAENRHDYEVVYGEQGTCLVTDLADAYAVYVIRVVDTGRFPPKFVEALATRLAWDRAPSIAGEAGFQLRGQLLSEYIAAKLDAATDALNEGRDTRAFVTPSIAARGGT